MQMSEIEREDILAQRLEEMQPILDKRNLDQMLKAQAAGAMNNSEEDSVSKAAKRVSSRSLHIANPRHSVSENRSACS
jgi:RNA polymerase-associated protein RTF1